MKTLEPWYHMERAAMGASVNKGATNHAIAAGIRYHKRIYATLKAHCSVSLPTWRLYIEPWFRTADFKGQRSPDAVLRERDGFRAVVIEVKKNWKDGRDVKLLQEYLPIVSSAFGVDTYPLMIVGNVRGLTHEPFLSLAELLSPLAWRRGQPTPTLLKPL